jgi:hypothetical protein
VSRRRIAAIDAETGRIVICKVLYDVVIVVGNISEMIVMIRHILMIDSRTVLRTMFIAGVLAVLLVGSGTAWVVDDDGGVDFVNMQTAEAAA